MKSGSISATFLSLMLVACAVPTPRQPLKNHISSETITAQAATGDIPPTVQQSLAPPRARSAAKTETYSVVVNNVPVRDLLFAISRDAKVNVDIHPGISGSVSLNAINQTLAQLLSRIAKQVDMRFEMDGPNLSVIPDSPFLKHYKVDYVNMSRNVTGTVSANTQIATGVPGTGGGSGTGASSNTSKTEITNTSKNVFWESLEKNIKDILHETDKTFPEGSSETVTEQSNSQNASGTAVLPQGGGGRAGQNIANILLSNPTPSSTSQVVGNTTVRRNTFREAASVIINAESGTVTVRATQRQHDRIQEFVDRVTNAARRQVLIEATIVEVELGDGYQQGIEWSRLRADGSGFSITPASINTNVGSAVQPFKMTYQNLTNPLNLVAAVNLLESFGTAKVLSSPRLSVMNNQTALLKVVENFVYFNVKADTSTTANVAQNTTVTTTPQSVSVGLVMTVTPQISSNDAVILNVRPSISSVAELKRDPNPVIPADIPNYVPQIRTREIESIMRVNSGEIAVLGGLMTDSVDWKTGRVPLAGQIPLVGEIFNTRNNASKKSELVIFLRPVVIKDASLNGDYSSYRSQLPGDQYFEQSPEAQPFNFRPTPIR